MYVMSGLLLASCPMSGWACPEMIVPVDPSDSALDSRAWRGALRLWKAGQYTRANTLFRKKEKRLARDVRRLFHPASAEKTVSNQTIQKWLQRYVYTDKPSVLIYEHRFTFPALVWWAIADTACRLGQLDTADHALKRLTELRNGGDADQHRTLVLLYREKFEQAAKLLLKLPPDGFLTPYIAGWLAASSGYRAEAKKQLQIARAAAALGSQRNALEKLISKYRLAE